MKEADRQRSIRTRLARLETQPSAAVATGFPALDAAAGGGLPRGSVIEVFGPPGCGKTTLALQLVAHLQLAGGASAWIDAEHAFDAAYAARLRVAVERLPLARPESAEEALEIARRLAASGAVDLVVVDSAAALVPQLELETAIGHSGFGLQARVLGSGLRRLSRDLRRSGTIALFLNQARARPSRGNPGGEAAETSAGGPSLKMWAALRLSLEPCGISRICFRVLKNKAAEPFTEGHLEWGSGVGFAETR